MSTISSGTTLTTALVQTGDTTGELVIKTNNGNTTAATFTTTGNLGIGTTSPARKVDARSTSSDYQYRAGDTANPVLSYDFGRENTNGLFRFYGNQTGATGYSFSGVDGERMRIDTSGNVGIGTSSPGTRLQVGNPSDSNQALRFDFSDSSTARINSTRVGAGNLQSLMLAGQDTMQFQTNGAERMRIGTAGQIGIGGANYGTSGQVLTSGGSGAAPTWSDVSVTTAAVLAATAGASLGAVGAYSWLWTTTTGAVTAGSTIAGSNLRYAGFQTGASGDNNNSDNSLSGNGGTPSGTWRVMGRGAQTNYSVFLALRIS